MASPQREGGEEGGTAAKTNREGFDAKQIVFAESWWWGRRGGEAEEDKLLRVIRGAAGLRFIYLYGGTPPRKQSKLLPRCQNGLLLDVSSAESLYYMQIYKMAGPDRSQRITGAPASI